MFGIFGDGVSWIGNCVKKCCETVAVTEESREEREGKRREKTDRKYKTRTNHIFIRFIRFIPCMGGCEVGGWVAFGVRTKGKDTITIHKHKTKTTNTTYHVVGRSR